MPCYGKTCVLAHWSGDSTCPDCRASVGLPLQIGAWRANSKNKRWNQRCSVPALLPSEPRPVGCFADTSGSTQDTPAPKRCSTSSNCTHWPFSRAGCQNRDRAQRQRVFACPSRWSRSSAPSQSAGPTSKGLQLIAIEDRELAIDKTRHGMPSTPTAFRSCKLSAMTRPRSQLPAHGLHRLDHMRKGRAR